MNHTKIVVVALGFLLSVSMIQVYASTNGDKSSSKQQLELLKQQADSAEQQKNLPQLVSIYKKIVDLCRSVSELNDKLPENLYQYGLWLSYAGNYQEAINTLIELMEMDAGEGNKHIHTLQAGASMQLGMTYFFLERWDDALVHYRKAREMAMTLDNKQGVSIAENNIGNIYQKKGNYLQAIEQYRLSLQLQEDIEDKETVCNTYYNLGTCYRELDNYKEALSYFNQSLQMAKEIGETETYTLCLVELAHYNAIEKKLFHEAEQQIIEAETLAQKAGYKQVLKEVYHTRVLIEEARGNIALAFAYCKKYQLISDTLFKEHSVDKLHEYEVRYQTQEKELEILRQQTEIDHHKRMQYIYIGGLCAAGVVLILLIYAIWLRTKRNRELREINATKDKFFSIISHDLKNPAIAQRNALQLLAKNGSSWDNDTLSQYHNELLKSADYQVELLYGLLNWAQMQTGRMPYIPIDFDLAESLRHEVGMLQNMTNHKHIKLNVQLPTQAIVTGDRNMITTVVRNLLTNAIKFTGEGGWVSLEVSPSDKGYMVVIKDNGIGMSEEQMNNLFRIDYQQSKSGTAGEQGSGLGLIVCKELLGKHGKTLIVESEQGKGSVFGFLMDK